MSTQLKIISLLAAASICCTAGAETPVTADQVSASFERVLNHESAPAGIATRDSLDDDVLYVTINQQLWPSFSSEDPVLASFERAFNHQPVTSTAVAVDTRDILTEQFQTALFSGQSAHSHYITATAAGGSK